MVGFMVNGVLFDALGTRWLFGASAVLAFIGGALFFGQQRRWIGPDGGSGRDNGDG